MALGGGRIIASGPSKWKLILSLFEPDQSNEVGFGFADDPKNKTWVIIDSAKRLDGKGEEWELECYLPHTGMWHFLARYSTKTRKGVQLKSWQEPVF